MQSHIYISFRLVTVRQEMEVFMAESMSEDGGSSMLLVSVSSMLISSLIALSVSPKLTHPSFHLNDVVKE
jgi:hypothetical protein